MSISPEPMHFPKDFKLPPGVDSQAFYEAMSDSPTVSLRLNRRKCNDPSLLGYENLHPVEWCKHGYYLETRPKFTLNPLLHAGAFYVQEASSMIYETILDRLINQNIISSCPSILDMCAAPGGKTTAMLNAIDDDALVVANEIMTKRAAILKENILKWGSPNVIVTSRDPQSFQNIDSAFDLVALDAPCSGEGMMRKDSEAIKQWSNSLVESCAALQKKLLTSAMNYLRPGGILIFSTCTFNEIENEQNVKFAIEHLGFEPVKIELPAEYGISPQCSGPYPAMRFMPHLTKGEGLFVAVLRKPGDRYLSDNPERLNRKIINALDNAAVSNKKKILKRESLNKSVKLSDSRPDPSLPLSTNYQRGSYPEVELNLDDALKYLRHEALVLPESEPAGYIVVTYKNIPLGFVKNLGKRANNLYPSEWRIRTL